MTPDQQLQRWVAGRSQCPNTSGECCPDFSRCRPQLSWPVAKRRAFMAAPQHARERMLVSALVGLLVGESRTTKARGFR